ncbi:MAG: YicC family protein [Deltaproteobacteria bacterium]|nr:MAG: YicC family protein [Deltaproteobacteria bacterium]
MLKSMTGYGKAEAEAEDLIFTVEIKTLNSRFRDIIIRMPQEFQELEMDIRKWIAERISRGRVEVYIKTEPIPDRAEYEVVLNEPLAKAYMDVFNRIMELFPVDSSVSIDTFCHLRDVIIQRPKERDIEKLRLSLKTAIEKALDSVDEMRKREGMMLQEDILKRIEKIKRSLLEVKQRASVVVESYRDRLRQGVERLLQGQEISLDEDRIIQEVAIFAEKSDITEEIVRIESHITQFLNFINKEEPIGRRLDFLIQEMNREVNTIGAKSQDAIISNFVVDMKAEIEKIREQVQNIE